MICRINNRAVSPASVFFREMGFGQPVLDAALHLYLLEYDSSEILDLLRSEYGEWIRDQKVDDERTRQPYPGYFRELGYPAGIEEFAAHRAYFEDAIKRFFYLPLFSASFPQPPEGKEVRWVINDIDSVQIKDDKVFIAGKAFSTCAARETHNSQISDRRQRTGNQEMNADDARPLPQA